MPVIKSAIKKLRKDKKLEKTHDEFRNVLELAIKKAKKTGDKKSVSEAFSLVDKAVKKHILHKNRAARVKASLTKNDPKVKPSATKPEAPKASSPKTSSKTPKKTKSTKKA